MADQTVNETYTVRQLARVAGVSVRTLHYYDQIGLLRPASYGDNGYRYYDRQNLLRLQQVLFFRELDFSLEEIRSILARPDFDLVHALEVHRTALQERIHRLRHLIRTVDHTLENIKGELEMSNQEYFEGFSEEKQKEYEKEAARRWGDTKVKESQKRWSSYSAAEKKRILEEGKTIYVDIVAAMPLGPASPQVQSGVARWHQHLRYFYEPTTETLLGLGDLYNDDPAFNATFQRIHPDLAAFMRQAIRIYCDELAA